MKFHQTVSTLSMSDARCHPPRCSLIPCTYPHLCKIISRPLMKYFQEYMKKLQPRRGRDCNYFNFEVNLLSGFSPLIQGAPDMNWGVTSPAQGQYMIRNWITLSSALHLFPRILSSESIAGNSSVFHSFESQVTILDH